MTILIKVAGLHIARHVVIWYYGGNRVCDTHRRMYAPLSMLNSMYPYNSHAYVNYTHLM